MQTSTKKQLSPTVWFLLTGLVLGWIGVWNLGAAIPNWSHGSLESPSSLVVIHLLILGFMLTVAYGVLFQIVPIAFQSPPLPRHVLYWHLPIHTLAVLCMVSGFMTGQWIAVGWGGVFLMGTGIGFFGFLQRSYRKSRNQTPVHRMLKFPMVCLLTVILVGLWQAFAPAATNASTLMLHVTLGGLGFWGGLVIVISYKLIPMFSLSHGYRAHPFWAGALFFGGIAVLCLTWLAEAIWHTVGPSAWMGPLSQDIGALLSALGFASVGLDVYHIIRARKRKRMVRPVVQALVSTFVMLASGIGVCMALVFHAPTTVFIRIGYVYMFAGLIPLILAYMQKIVPFLWYEYRYSHRPERKTAPLMDEMVPRALGHAGWSVYSLGVLAGFGSLMLQGPAWLDQSAGAVATLGMVILFVGLRYVLTIGGKRPEN